ncbi:hypothetical protein MKW98_015277 [Papaver atlanticum]|uniref:RING-type E3 ubiquitin transferase n=1 Tax=Papaver atlanticum TaxID=357466 RepID=A0AAD4T577_9MAGN|nr:hypothetical protein MKW98_015277 [Papaver atlanticum]
METKEIMNMKENQEMEEDEEKICRICHSPGDSENPLQYPCACSGSMKFVHPKCLLQWKKQRVTFECEVCKHKFSVYRVYAENTPTRLPLREFVGGIAVKACHVLHICVMFLVSVFYLLFMVPLLIIWICRLYFVRSLSEVYELLVHSHMSPSTLMMDWLYGIGFLLVVTMVMVLCGCTLHLVFSYDVPLRSICIQLATDMRNFLIFLGVLILVPFSLGRIVLHCLSWLFFAALSIFMPFTKSAVNIENNSLKNALHAFTNLTTEIQNDGLVLCVVEVVAESLAANSIGQGGTSSSVGKPHLVNRSPFLYNVITLATGYMVVAPLVFVFFDIPIRTVASKIRYYLRKFLTTMNYSFFLLIHLGVLPLVYGWWLDICTIAMFGKSISDRVEFFSKFPLLSSSMHWTTGIIYMFQIRISTSLLQRVLHKEVQYLFQDLADPISKILHVVIDDVQVQARQFLFSIAVNGILIVFLIYLPVVLAMQLAPTIFPLHISASDPFTEIPVVMLVLQLCLPYTIELRETVAALLHQWVTSVCCVLGLSGFLRSRPEDIGRKENVEVERQQDIQHDGLIASQDPNKNIFTSQNFDGVGNYASDEIDDGHAFEFRVVLLVVLAWITLLLISTSLIIVCLPLGRVLFSSISNLPITHGIKCNDLYAFFIGNFSIWTSFTGARYFSRHFKAGKAHLRFSDICKLLCIIVESCVLLSLWIIVIPVLIGLLFELSVMVPSRALVVEAPVLLLCQDWVVGFLFFKLWRTLVLLNHRIVLMEESWRFKFERVRENDFLKLPRRWMLQEILIPIIMNLLMSLCLLYVLTRWIVPLLGFLLTVNSTVYRFTWVACVTIIVLFSCAKRFLVWITNLHDSIRDDRYSGLGLQNFGEAAMECENEIDKLVIWLSESQGANLPDTLTFNVI